MDVKSQDVDLLLKTLCLKTIWLLLMDLLRARLMVDLIKLDHHSLLMNSGRICTIWKSMQMVVKSGTKEE